MARPGLDRNVKFKVLVKRLGLPRPYVRGLLDTMWEVAYETGNPALGDKAAVEAAAEWPGEPGVLFTALRDGRWIDPGPDGTWVVHDLYDHAPEYVRKRMDREAARRERGVSLEQVRSDAARQAANARWSRDHAGPSAPVRNDASCLPRGIQDMPCSTPPSPAPAPAPAPKKGDSVPLQPPVRATAGPDPGGFDKFWAAYPKKVDKTNAIKVWTRINPDPGLLKVILAAVGRQKASPDWQDKQYIPGPAKWLRGRRWEDEVEPAAGGHTNDEINAALGIRHPKGAELAAMFPDMFGACPNGEAPGGS
jgi:hypothetical protein